MAVASSTAFPCSSARPARASKSAATASSASATAASAAARRLQSLLAPFTPGNCPVLVSYRNADALCELALGEGSRVRLEDDLLSALGDWLSSENVRIDYS